MNRNWLDPYNVVWTTPSRNSGESMPCGGHDIGLNVWVEDGALLFYMDRTGSFDENHQMLKLGRVRVKLDPNPFADGAPFRQVLNLRKGHVEIEAGDPAVRLLVWVEVFRPVIHVEVEAGQPLRMQAIYENWRRAPVDVPPKHRHATISLRDYEGPVTTWPDAVGCEDGGVVFCHRNRDDDLLRDKLIAQQGLEAVAWEIPDTQRGRTFGGWMGGPGLMPDGEVQGCYLKTEFIGWVLASSSRSSRHHLDIFCHTAQTETIEAWREALVAFRARAVPDAKAKAEAWWERFWSRSRICINPDAAGPADPAWQVGRNYQLFRYMLGCNAFGDYPSKFNGSLFTFDPGFISGEWMNSLANEDLTVLTPDFRCWGGGSFTGQNQRLVYWPMLKTGDFDLMPPQFDYYRRGLPGAEARVRHYWGHGGCCFAEQLENFGLPFGWGYGWSGADESHARTPDLEPGVQAGKWIRYHYDSQVEFALMVVEYHRYCGKPIERWLPFIRSVLRFFDEHYRFRARQTTGREFDAEGKYIFAPSTALETYKNARNPLTVIAGLRVLIDALLDLDAAMVDEPERERLLAMREKLPELPTRELNGHRLFAPAETYDLPAINMEDPQLYAVFPYPMALPGNAWWQIAQDTWDHDDFKVRFRVCWGQTEIWAARLGRTDEAKALIVEKIQDSGRRFPAFWGPGPDWVPDVDHGGAGMIGLQEMLMQCDGDAIRLLPAWPKDWDVDFRLHAPGNTVVEGRVEKGRLAQLDVTPSERMGDVIIA